ncbi:hypothetical protein DFA_12347 [Cavenderia fasciculata]|uniref:Ankyrin repeat-containing protein n=1 Tax=Cavenderia fasciculata TaxID=261658 RepID=F4QDF2_CACFS|nr:uncharacterized protein DFA_12347 [Cavenderia fasciculata]EGG14570.1 hypothetical protein DFA_12347 [Cavenderia fasciculata]|eukprot:XP_004366090.1 hypothetical protein DFA_12347 [Cavenderia fasciculata]
MKEMKIVSKHIHSIHSVLYSDHGSKSASYRFNDIPSLKWVVENETGSLLHDLCIRSIQSGKLPLETNLQVGWATLDLIMAVCSPHKYHPSVKFKLSTFKVIFEYYRSAFEQEHIAVDCAAASGNFELVKFLLANGTPFTTNAIDHACSNGHLEIIQLLIHSTLKNDPTIFDDNVKFTNHSYDMAATNGHLKVVEYLESLKTLFKKKKSKYRVEFSKDAIDGAAKNANWHVVHYMLDLYKRDASQPIGFMSETKGQIFSSAALQWSVAHGNLQVLEKLLDFPHPDKSQFNKGGGGAWVVEGLTSGPNLETVKWIYNNRFISYVANSALKATVEKNQKDVLLFYMDLINDDTYDDGDKEKKMKSMRPISRDGKEFEYPNLQQFHYPLKHAIVSANSDLFHFIYRCLEKGPVPPFVHSLLKLACEHGQLDILKSLLANKKKEKRSVEDRLELLEIAAKQGNDKMIQMLLESDLFTNILPNNNSIVLCASSASVECMQILLSRYQSQIISTTNHVRSHQNSILSLLLEKDTTSLGKVQEEEDKEQEEEGEEEGRRILKGNFKKFFEKTVQSGSIACIQFITTNRDDPTLADIYSLASAMDSGHVYIVSFILENYPYLSVTQPTNSKEQIAISNSLENAIQRGDIKMIDYILGLKLTATTSTSTTTIAIDIDSLESTQEHLFQVTPRHLQSAVNRCDIPMIRIIHRHRQYLLVGYPHKLLSRGFIKMFKETMQWNVENGESDSVVYGDVYLDQFGNWYHEMISLGNIDLAKYIEQRKITSLPIIQDDDHDQDKISVMPITSHIRTLYFIQQQQKHLNLTPKTVDAIYFSSVEKDHYSSFKVLSSYQQPTNMAGNAIIHKQAKCNNNLSILRLHYSRFSGDTNNNSYKDHFSSTFELQFTKHKNYYDLSLTPQYDE